MEDVNSKCIRVFIRDRIKSNLSRVAIELLEGAVGGSKFFNYYIPNGNKTGVTVVGEFRSMMHDENQLKQAVMSFLEQASNEDSAYLKTMS